jgi:hypothetical protein
MKRRSLISWGAAVAAAAAFPARAAAPLPRVQVFKNPACGCCGAWVEHMKTAGFPVQVVEVPDTSDVRQRAGLPDRYGSCHTALVAGYVVEGHVPARDVQRLLAMKPAAVGLAVPGMPVGSPGMEQGAQKDPYDVLLVDRQGRANVFARYR